jgi:small subunit ribosomal protein S6
LETVAKNKLYEGMFLIDSSQAASDWDGINAAIKKILKKTKAEIVSIAKWDDRRLAYDIRGKSRGTYILSYFRVDGGRIKDIEKSVRLSEKIMRVLILSAEQLNQEDIEKDTPAMKLEKEKQQKSQQKTQQTEATTPPPKEKTGDFQVSGVSTAAEDFIEEHPEQEQIEGSEQAGEKEQL